MYGSFVEVQAFDQNTCVETTGFASINKTPGGTPMPRQPGDLSSFVNLTVGLPLDIEQSGLDIPRCFWKWATPKWSVEKPYFSYWIYISLTGKDGKNQGKRQDARHRAVACRPSADKIQATILKSKDELVRG